MEFHGSTLALLSFLFRFSEFVVLEMDFKSNDNISHNGSFNFLGISLLIIKVFFVHVLFVSSLLETNQSRSEKVKKILFYFSFHDWTIDLTLLFGVRKVKEISFSSFLSHDCRKIEWFFFHKKITLEKYKNENRLKIPANIFL